KPAQIIYPNDPNHGCNHSWEVWNKVDYPVYAADEPRFMAEFGWCSLPARSTLETAIGAEHLQPWDDVLMKHYKSQDGVDKLRRAIADGFTEPSRFKDWHYVTQVQQARAVGFGLDYWRSLWPRCQGALVWQLNDCWPVTSWAAVDSAGIRKPMWHAAKRSFEPRLALVLAVSEGYVIRLVNNTDEVWAARPLVRKISLDGTTRASWSVPVSVPPQEVAELPLDISSVYSLVNAQLEAAICESDEPYNAPDQRVLPGELQPGRWLLADEILVVDADAEHPNPVTRRVVALPDKCLDYVRPAYDVETVGNRVRVSARSLVRDLLLQPDVVGASGDAPLVTLLPGESYEWVLDEEVTGDVGLLDAASVELSAREIR
ncbi:MAG: hypothetical protein LBR21_10615, partial [Propionibacteriaceae bacterium]|nr:hypothetical protein [Propionibacteriaceae bacterium]